MIEENIYYTTVRDVFAKSLGMILGASLAQRFANKDPKIVEQVTDVAARLTEATAKKLVDEDRKLWNQMHQPPARDIHELAQRAWAELDTQAKKDAYLQRLIDGS